MIVNNIEQFEKVIPTAEGIKYEQFETYLRSAERWLKNHILGKNLFDKIESTEDIDLKNLCVSVLCLHAYHAAIPFLDLIQTANGFAVVSNGNHAPASKNRVDRLIEQSLKRRDNELENLIDYLESEKQYHDDWKGAPSYSIISEGLIQTSTEMKRFCSWEGSRSEFMQLKPTLILKIKTELYKYFGKEIIEEIIEQQRDNDISPSNSMIIESLKFCLANFAIGNNSEAVSLRDSIINVLDCDIESFPKYRDSSEYKARLQEGFKNTKDSPIFSFGV